MSNAPQLVIFDCDGVLVDSEPLSCRVLAEEVSKLGYAMDTPAAIRAFAGGSFQRVLDFIQLQTNRPAPDDFDAIYRKRTHELFEQELVAVEGVEAVLEKLDYARCVGSNGPLHKIEFNLRKTGLDRFFHDDHLFSAYQIDTWKPDPALYLHAAQKMGVAPAHCVVVEDSVLGVQAGVAAGMRVLGYTGTKTAEQLQQAGATPFADMKDLIRLLG